MLLVKYYLQKDVSDIPALLRLLHEHGISVISLTDGDKGSFAIDKEGKMYHLKTLEAPVVERTGAGDAYAAGFLSAMLEGKEVSDAMRFGAVNAAAVIGAMGAQTGLLTKEAMQEKLMQYPSFQAESI